MSVSQQPAEPDWKNEAPYRPRDENSAPIRWGGRCHCGKVEYQLSRDKPLASKYCHCQDCQKLHGAPFQWAAIFHKEDMTFTRGTEGLGWYHSRDHADEHHLPCKVSCAHCRSPRQPHHPGPTGRRGWGVDLLHRGEDVGHV